MMVALGISPPSLGMLDQNSPRLDAAAGLAHFASWFRISVMKTKASEIAFKFSKFPLFASEK